MADATTDDADGAALAETSTDAHGEAGAGSEADGSLDSEASDGATDSPFDAAGMVPKPLFAFGTGMVGGYGAPRVAVDADGNAFIAAHYFGAWTLPDGTLTCSGYGTGLVRLDPKGKLVWKKCIDSELMFYRALATGPGGKLVVGTAHLASSAARAAVHVYDAGGTEVWAKLYDVSPQQSLTRGVAFGPSGEVIAVFDHTGAIDFGGGPAAVRATIVRFRSDGTLDWVRALGDAHLLDNLATDPSGNVYATGTADAGPFDYGDGAKSYPTGAIVVSHDTKGKLRFVQRMSGGSLHAVAADDKFVWALGAMGGVTLPSGAKVASGSNAIVALDGATGVDQWHEDWEPTGSGGWFDVAAAGKGRVVVASSKASVGLYFQLFDDKGKPLWPGWTPSATANGTGVAVTPLGEIMLVGTYRGTMDFGITKLIATDSVSDGSLVMDMFVARFAP